MTDNALSENFLELIEENKKLIYKVSHMFSDKDIDRNDLFQEIIVNLWKAYPTFKGHSKISTWIYRIAINTAVSQLRDFEKKNNHIQYTNMIPQVPEDSGFNELLEQLYTAIKKLGKLDRAIILLQLEGYSYEEIAEIMGLSKTNVATKINRVKLKLKNQLSNS